MTVTFQNQQQKWDKRYSGKERIGEPARVLTSNLDLLPQVRQSGSRLSLDVACGLAANGLLLAARGFGSHCWDISPVAIEKVKAIARENGLPVTAVARDVETEMPGPGTFDVIVVSRYLHRPLCPALSQALKPGGRLFYQTFALREDGSIPEIGPQRAEYRLKRGELLTLFPELKVLRYQESPLRNEQGEIFSYESWLVAEKP